MRTDILTITLNPAVDLATTAPQVLADLKLRCSAPQVDPGGGGINVARAVRLLDGQATALVAIGGTTGARLLELLTHEGVPTVAFQGPGETRQSLSVTETATGLQYRFVMPGPDWTEADVARALRSVDQSAGDGTLVVLSGSQPPGVAKEFPSMLAEHVTGRGARLIVDTSGPALTALAGAPRQAIDTLRMDGAEAEELAGHPLPSRQDSADFARSLVVKGVARQVIVARGPDGSVLSNDAQSWHCTGPVVEVISKVGAGDSFVGAYTLSRARGAAAKDALRYGVAAASAACMTEATRLCDPEVTERLLDECVLTPL
ncbi:MAG: sugar kinase [Rhodobacteraceae bacterium]|nr:sugar kinase [Paracoccaceae bacterium]QEW18874.1 6-phosphofructokinase isozyme 2 [Marinibacterium anthonyi]